MNMKLSDVTKVSLVTAVCILALAAISKNVLHVQLDFIFSIWTCLDVDRLFKYKRGMQKIKNL